MSLLRYLFALLIKLYIPLPSLITETYTSSIIQSCLHISTLSALSASLLITADSML